MSKAAWLEALVDKRHRINDGGCFYGDQASQQIDCGARKSRRVATDRLYTACSCESATWGKYAR